MAAKKREDRSPVNPVLRVAPLGELKVYMITEEELDALGRGFPGSVFLNFSLALLPLSAAFLITLVTTTIDGVGALVFFICACLICFLAGLLCLSLAWKMHVSTRAVVARIRNRMPPPPPISQETADGGGSADPGAGTAPPL